MSQSFTVALAGNPNSGKTSIFNALTGSHQKVGNWPGVTVEKKEGKFECSDIEINIVDLPGIYSLSADSVDQKIAVDFLINEKPDAVICVVDSSNFERNMYLTLQLIEMGQKVIIDLNMTDIAEKNGVVINESKLSEILKCPVVKTVAINKQGLEELKKAIVSTIKASIWNSPKIVNYPEPIEKSSERLISELRKHWIKNDIDPKWITINLLSGDMNLLGSIGIGDTESKKNFEKFVLHEVVNIEKELNKEIDIIIAEKRYERIKDIFLSISEKKDQKKTYNLLTNRLDKLLINKYLGIPIFLGVMYLTFTLVFSVGGFLADLIDMAMINLGEFFSNMMKTLNAPDIFTSFIVDGIIGGVGSVLVFLPNIVILYLAIGFLEDTGYMARAAFVMDRIMQFLGLPGKAFIPLLLGFGCNVPAVMAARTMESEKDRILTVLITPLMSCSARLPIYVLFASIFFQEHQAFIVFLMYVIGIIVAIAVGKILQKSFFDSKISPLVMELPVYRMPRISSVLLEVWRRSSIFLRKAGTIIFSVVIVVWLLSSLPFGVEYASENSVIGYIGRIIAPILKLPGFGFWQAGVALVFGFLAKEVVIGTFGVLFGGEEILKDILINYFTPLSAFSFMVFCLIYVPCVATLAIIKNEIGRKWAWFTAFYTTISAWIISTLIYQVGRLFI